MGWIIFTFVLLVVALEALVGVLRGVKLSGIRVGYTVLGTLIAALIAKSLTVTIILKIAAANGLEGDSLTAIVTNFFASSDFAAIGAAVAPHIAGLSLSVMIPLVFVPLFLVFKLIGLFLYLITKLIIKKITKNSESAEQTATEDAAKPAFPVYSRVLGGVIGGLVGLFTCALITMPMFNLVTTINNSGMKETVFSMLEKSSDQSKKVAAVEKNEKVAAVLQALAYGDAIPVYAADDDATIGGIKISLIRSLFESTANSPAIVVMRYTGVEAATNAIINASTTVKPKDIGAEKVKTESYNLNEALSEILEVIEPVTELVIVVTSDEGFKLDELDKVTSFANKLESAGFLAEEDKLDIVNACKEVVTDTIYKELGVEASTESSDYSSIEEFTKDVEAIVEISKVIASVTGGGNENSSTGSSSGQTVTGDSLANIDVDALLKEPEKLKSFVSSTLSLSNGPDIIANLVNSNVSKYTEGKYTNVITAETIKSVGKDTIVGLSDSLMKFTKYDENTPLTEELKQEILDAIDEVAAKGLLKKEDAEEIKKEFELK